MMLLKYLQIAKHAIRQKRDRNLLTIFGIICGIGSITLAINFGLGVQQQIIGDSNTGDNLLTIRSGQSVARDQNGEIVKYNLNQTAGSLPSLTIKDLRTVQREEAIETIAPIANLNEEIKDLSGNSLQNGHAIATEAGLLEIINYEINHGANTLDDDTRTAIIGDEVARELYNNSRPISHEIIVGDQNFLIVGVLKDPERLNPLNIGFNWRRAVLIPFATLEEIHAEAETETFIYEILATTKQEVGGDLIKDISGEILENHEQKHDFTVFKGNELIFLTSEAFQIFRNLVLIISVIFLVVAGIGLTNSMQASVAERRLEISIRKSIGATNQQILHQFLVEALVISMLGGALGVISSLVLSLTIDYFTPVQPVIQLDVTILMLLLSPLLGLIFGVQAAAQAALQKPEDYIK